MRPGHTPLAIDPFDSDHACYATGATIKDLVNESLIHAIRNDRDTITWEATVEDPDVLTQPFVMEPRTVRLNPNAKATLTEDLPCEERDTQHIVTHERG